jgi:UDP-glucuronate 4-epimerase
VANYLVTGAAGFIGARTSEILFEQGNIVTGVDNLNDAIDVRMKDYRLRKLQVLPGFTLHKFDVSERDGITRLVEWYKTEREWAKNVIKPR